MQTKKITYFLVILLFITFSSSFSSAQKSNTDTNPYNHTKEEMETAYKGKLLFFKNLQKLLNPDYLMTLEDIDRITDSYGIDLYPVPEDPLQFGSDSIPLLSYIKVNQDFSSRAQNWPSEIKTSLFKKQKLFFDQLKGFKIDSTKYTNYNSHRTVRTKEEEYISKLYSNFLNEFITENKDFLKKELINDISSKTSLSAGMRVIFSNSIDDIPPRIYIAKLPNTNQKILAVVTDGCCAHATFQTYIQNEDNSFTLITKVQEKATSENDKIFLDESKGFYVLDYLEETFNSQPYDLTFGLRLVGYNNQRYLRIFCLNKKGTSWVQQGDAYTIPNSLHDAKYIKFLKEFNKKACPSN